jgi:predicted transcriptional regulator
MKSPQKQSSSANTDIFGTYLGEVSGRTAIEQIVERVRHSPRTVGELARELSFTPEDIASAVGNAVKLGLVRLESKGDDTIVMPAGFPTV